MRYFATQKHSFYILFFKSKQYSSWSAVLIFCMWIMDSCRFDFHFEFEGTFLSDLPIQKRSLKVSIPSENIESSKVKPFSLLFKNTLRSKWHSDRKRNIKKVATPIFLFNPKLLVCFDLRMKFCKILIELRSIEQCIFEENSVIRRWNVAGQRCFRNYISTIEGVAKSM